MAQEIERKFLVVGDFKSFATKKTRIRQAYLSTAPERSVRIRINGDKGFITIKGIVSKSGTSRFEWENEISLTDAKNLLELCEPGMIDKTRYIVKETGGLQFEVDEFYGNNQGLTIAEIELPTEGHHFEKPEWLGEEVTGMAKYYNSMLIKNPFKNW